MLKQWAAALAVAVLLAAADARADIVTLRSLDGDISLTGELLGYDGDLYRIASDYGILSVDGSAVECSGKGCPVAGQFVAKLMISGAALGAGTLVPALIEGFAASEGYNWVRQDEDRSHILYVMSESGREVPVAEIRIRATTSAEGFADLVAQQADLAVSFREPKPDELVLAGEAGLGDLSASGRGRVIALDAIVPVVGWGSALQEVSLAELASLFSGRMQDWPDDAGPEGPARLHLTAPRSATVDAFRDLVLAPRELDLVEDVTWHADRESLLNALASDPAAIGILALSSVQGAARTIPLQGSCGILAMAGSESVKAEDYPLTQPHYLYLPRRRLSAVGRAFLTYVASPEAQQVIRAAGFVDQDIEARPAAAQGNRLIRAIAATGSSEVTSADLRRMARSMIGSARLTPTFRFDDGSAQLDSPSQASIAVVADAIRRGTFDGGTLLVAGFGDGLGAASANLALSRERAEVVRTAILEALEPEVQGQVVVEAEGFGEALPMACDEDAWGRSVNRRVELWLVQR